MNKKDDERIRKKKILKLQRLIQYQLNDKTKHLKFDNIK